MNKKNKKLLCCFYRMIGENAYLRGSMAFVALYAAAAGVVDVIFIQEQKEPLVLEAIGLLKSVAAKVPTMSESELPNLVLELNEFAGAIPIDDE